MSFELKRGEAALVIHADLTPEILIPGAKETDEVSHAGYAAAILGVVFSDEAMFKAAKAKFDAAMAKQSAKAMAEAEDALKKLGYKVQKGPKAPPRPPPGRKVR